MKFPTAFNQLFSVLRKKVPPSDLCPPLLQFNPSIWHCLANAEIYFRASSEMLAQWKTVLARRRGLPDVPPQEGGGSNEWCWEALLTPSERILVKQMRAAAEKEILVLRQKMMSLPSEDCGRRHYEGSIAGKHSGW